MTADELKRLADEYGGAEYWGGAEMSLQGARDRAKAALHAAIEPPGDAHG